MNNLFGLLFAIVFGAAGLLSIFMIVNLLLPAVVEKTRACLELSIGRCLLLGLVNSVLAAALIALCTLPMRAGGVLAAIFILVGGLIGLLMVALVLLGLVSAAALLGSKTGAVSPVASHVRGGLLIILACLTPFLGWFVITPLVLWTALGAAILAVYRQARPVEVAAPPQPVADV